MKRECLEEIGAEISIIKSLAQGNYYFYSTTLNINMESVGYFFICKIEKYLDVKIDDNHELLWMKAEKVVPLMYLENQKEAIKIFQKNS